jgi:hypothetical protein
MAVVLGIVLLARVASSDPSAEGLESMQPETSSAGEDSGGLQTALAPTDPRSWPISGALGERLFCIEYHESRHFGGARNPYSGASGWLQWLPATARAWGVQIGDRVSEWHAAARIAARGEVYFKSQWVPLQRGWC